MIELNQNTELDRNKSNLYMGQHGLQHGTQANGPTDGDIAP
jgi:hypothetical protein